MNVPRLQRGYRSCLSLDGYKILDLPVPFEHLVNALLL